MSFAISPIERGADTPSALDFMMAVDAAISMSDKNQDKLQSSAVVKIAPSDDNGGAVSVLKKDTAADNSSTLISVTTKPDDGPSGDNTPDSTDQTAVIITKDGNGDIKNATVINVISNNSDNTQTISISTKNADQETVISTITLDAQTLQGNAGIAYASVTNNPETGLPQSLFLITPSQDAGTSSDVFLVSLVGATDHIDLTDTFSNFGFTTFSGRDSGSSFGGAVTIDIGGRKIIVWMDAGQNVANDYSGELNAAFGTFEPDLMAPSSTIAGNIVGLKLVFSQSAITQIWQGDTLIDDLDGYVRQLVGGDTPPPVDAAVVEDQRYSIIRDAPFFDYRLNTESDAIRQTLVQPDDQNRLRPADYIRNNLDTIMVSRGNNAP
jgi:hypothetical protein